MGFATAIVLFTLSPIRAFTLERSGIREGRGISSCLSSSVWPGEIFLRLREAVESRESDSELEPEFEESCVEDPNCDPEFEAFLSDGVGVSGLALTHFGAMIRFRLPIIDTKTDG